MLMHGGGSSTVMIFAIFYLLLWGAIAVGGIGGYIFRGIGMYTLGRRRGMQSAWMAFVPVVRTYFQGELCGALKLGKRELKSPGIWMIVIPIAVQMIIGLFIAAIWIVIGVSLFGIINNINDYKFYGTYEHPYDLYRSGAGMAGTFGLTMLVLILLFFVVMVLVSTVQHVLIVLVNYQIFARYTDNNYALAHAVAGIFIPLYTSVYFFIIRNREKPESDMEQAKMSQQGSDNQEIAE